MRTLYISWRLLILSKATYIRGYLSEATYPRLLNRGYLPEATYPRLPTRGYLSGRMQRVEIGDTFSELGAATKGVPPGSALGSIFTIYLFFNIDDLFFHIKLANSKFTARADVSSYSIWVRTELCTRQTYV